MKNDVPPGDRRDDLRNKRRQGGSQNGPGADDHQQEPDDLPLVNAATLAGRPKPARLFLDSASLLPMMNVTLLSGDGGIGKSLLALQLAAAVVTSSAWLDFDVVSGSVIYMSAEDDLDELHIRLAEICAAEGREVAQLGGLELVPLAGRDAVLAAEDHRKGRLAETPLLGKLRGAMEVVNPALLVVDNLADVFAGNENVRPFAKHFIGMLRGLAIANGCALLLLGHPSLSGLNSGSGMSGSTAWHNSVRSRLYLTAKRDKNGDAEEETDPDQRWLKAMKANYAALAEPISLRWLAGQFVRAEPGKAFDGITTAHLEKVRSAFRNGAWRYDERSPDWGGNEVARIIDTDIAPGLTERDMTAAQKAARRKVRMLLSAWTRTNQIRVVERTDKKRMVRKFYEAV